MEDIYIGKGPEEIPLEEIIYKQPAPPPVPTPVKKKKKRGKIRKLIKILLIIFIVFSLVISAVSAVSGYTRNNLKSNQYISKAELHNNPLITNILLIGVDGNANESSRSDSMMLVSLDYMHMKIKMTSFLRDSWVNIPSKNTYHKLNAAYAYGGSQLITDTIEYNFKVDIDHYIKVDFEMFTEIIDRLGGIDIEVTESEAKFITKTTRYTLSPGESVHLDGAKALVYSRIRKLDSDYMRTFRQRKVITAIINKIRKTSPSELINIFRNVLPLLDTDLNPIELTGLLYKGGIAAMLFKIQQIRIPTDELMYADYRGSEWVEIIDLEGCQNQIYDFIYKSYNDKISDN